MTVRGGEKLKRFIRQAKAAEGSAKKRIQVGFFSSAKYLDGTPVTNVAAVNEFGNYRIPSRPFFRNALVDMPERLNEVAQKNIDSKIMAIDEKTANRLGLAAQDLVQRHITILKDPAKSEATLKKVPKKDNPLIFTGFMRLSVTYKID